MQTETNHTIDLFLEKSRGKYINYFIKTGGNYIEHKHTKGRAY